MAIITGVLHTDRTISTPAEKPLPATASFNPPLPIVFKQAYGEEEPRRGWLLAVFDDRYLIQDSGKMIYWHGWADFEVELQTR